MECLSPYLCMATVPHIMVRLERMLDYRGVGLARFHCIVRSVYEHCIECTSPQQPALPCIRIYIHTYMNTGQPAYKDHLRD